MKYINNRNKEPEELSKYRDTTPDATYDGLPNKAIIRQSLVEEQGYICAYCMGKIDVDRSSIEHYISQTHHPASPYSKEEHKKHSLLYSNMYGVCLNQSEHCDKKRGNQPIQILDPHHASCEKLITYTLDGRIIPAVQDADANAEKIKNDIFLLGLNCKKLKDRRIAAKDEVWERFQKEFKKEDWDKNLFQEKAEFYNNKHKKKGCYKFHAYCNFIAWFFNHYADNYKTK